MDLYVVYLGCYGIIFDNLCCYDQICRILWKFVIIYAAMIKYVGFYEIVISDF